MFCRYLSRCFDYLYFSPRVYKEENDYLIVKVVKTPIPMPHYVRSDHISCWKTINAMMVKDPMYC